MEDFFKVQLVAFWDMKNRRFSTCFIHGRMIYALSPFDFSNNYTQRTYMTYGSLSILFTRIRITLSFTTIAAKATSISLEEDSHHKTPPYN